MVVDLVYTRNRLEQRLIDFHEHKVVAFHHPYAGRVLQSIKSTSGTRAEFDVPIC